MTRAALGTSIDPAQAQKLADEMGLKSRRTNDPAGDVAKLLARDKIVAVATGRLEWGPRALGQRSILAAPTDPAIRDRINRVVKHREPFRPFAPAVLAHRAADYFAEAPSDMTPFMTTVCPMHESARDTLAAVTHADGTARVQTVTEKSAPELLAILEEMDRRTGLPVVLNTSLNTRGEPIVADASDAVAFFARAPIDAIAIGDLILERTPR